MKNYLEIQQELIPQRHSREAQNGLIQSVQRAVYKMAKRLQRRFKLSPDDVGDLVQAGLISVWHAIPSFKENGGASFATFVLTRARWKMVDELAQGLGALRVPKDAWVHKHVRHRLIRPKADSRRARSGDPDRRDDSDVWTDHLPPNEIDPVRDIDTGRAAKQLRAAVGKLKGRMREVIELELSQDLTQSEVAKLLGVSRQRVKQIEQRALGILSDHLLYGKAIPVLQEYAPKAKPIKTVRKATMRVQPMADQAHQLAAVG